MLCRQVRAFAAPAARPSTTEGCSEFSFAAEAQQSNAPSAKLEALRGVKERIGTMNPRQMFHSDNL
jgi:hypothetical protein